MIRLLSLLRLLPVFLALAGFAWGQVGTNPPGVQNGNSPGFITPFTAGDILASGASGQALDASQIIGAATSGYVNLPVGTTTGTIQFLYNTYSPFGYNIASGTAGSPITTPGPTVSISRTESLTPSNCNNNPDDNACNSGLAVYSVALATSGMQNSAIFGAAIGSQTGATGHDSVGGTFIGRVIGSGVGIGQGAYVEGRRDTTTGNNSGIEVRTTNETASGESYYSGGFNSGSLWLTAGGTANSACALCMGAVGELFDVGIGITAGSVATTGFRDDSNSITSIAINGTHTTQITATGASLSGAGYWTALGYSFGAAETCSGYELIKSSANNVVVCVNGFGLFQVSTVGAVSNSFQVTANNVPVNGINLPSANTLGLYTNSNLVMSIASTGIATLNTTNYASCTALTTSSSGVISCAGSAMRLKNPIILYDAARGENNIDHLDPAVWTFKDPDRYGAGEHVGLYADQVCALDERACVRLADGSIQNYDERAVIAWLVSAHKEDRRLINRLENR